MKITKRIDILREELLNLKKIIIVGGVLSERK